jgi:hypothetical protein
MTSEELAVTNRTFKMRIGERSVEVVQDGSGWLVSNGNIFADSWQSVWCPDATTLLILQEQISKGKPCKLPQGCKLLEKQMSPSDYKNG